MSAAAQTKPARRPRPEEPDFRVSPTDNEDLNWFFTLGRKPKGPWPASRRERHSRIERALAGRGYNLQRFYGARCELSAVSPDRAWAALVLRREYLAYTGNKAPRGRPGQARPTYREPFAVVPEPLAVLMITRRSRPEFVIEQDYDGRFRQHLAREAAFEIVGPTVAQLTEQGVLERSTWGDVRVGPAGARYLLETECWLDEPRLAVLRRLSDEQAVAEIRAREALYSKAATQSAAANRADILAALVPVLGAEQAEAFLLPTVEAQEPADDDFQDEHEGELDAREAELRKRFSRIDRREEKWIAGREWAGEAKHIRAAAKASEAPLGSAVPEAWDSRKLEFGDRDHESTTISELADKYQVHGRWVRAELIRLGCPGVSRTNRVPIPIAWLRSERGEKFRAAAGREHQRMAPIIAGSKARKRARPA